MSPVSTVALTENLPWHKRAAATVFLEHSHTIHDDLTAPLPPSSAPYETLAQFYFDVGCVFDSTPLTGKEISVLEGLSAMDLSYFIPGQCFRNATLIAARVPGLHYAEGIGIVRGRAVLHAWLALGAKAIDVTWAIDPADRPSKRFDRILQRIDHNIRKAHYYGLPIPMRLVSKVVLKTKYFSSILSDGRRLRWEPPRRSK